MAALEAQSETPNFFPLGKRGSLQRHLTSQKVYVTFFGIGCSYHSFEQLSFF
jgi:hypothetical protein